MNPVNTDHKSQPPEADSPERREALRRLAKLGIAAGAAPAMITLLWSDRASAQSGTGVSSVTASFARSDYSSGSPFQAAFPEGTLDLHAGDLVTTTVSYDPHGVSSTGAIFFYNSSGTASHSWVSWVGSSAYSGTFPGHAITSAVLPPDGEGPEGIEMQITFGSSDFEFTFAASV